MYKRIHQYVSGPGCAGDSRNSGSYSVHEENPLHNTHASILDSLPLGCRLLLLMALGHHTHTLTALVPLLYLLLW